MTNKQNIKKTKKRLFDLLQDYYKQKTEHLYSAQFTIKSKKTVPKSIPSTHVNHNVINKRSKRAERSNHIGISCRF